MNEQIYLTIIEIFVGLIIEGILISMVFSFLSNQASEKQNRHLKNEMNNIETQNKFIYEQLQKQIEKAKTELISQVKESAQKGGKN